MRAARRSLYLACAIFFLSAEGAIADPISKGNLFRDQSGRSGVSAIAGTYENEPVHRPAAPVVSTKTNADIQDVPAEAPDAHTFTSYIANNLCTLIFDRISPYRPYDLGPTDSRCQEPDSDRGRRRRNRGPDIAAIVQAALDRAIALAPDPELRMAPRHVGLTGLPTYVWDGARPAPITVTASAGGVTVVAEARITHYRWDFGENVDISTHPGRKWTQAHDGTIEHTYETKGFNDVSVEAIWAARWRIGAAPWQSLGYFSTSDSRRYPVQEVVTRLVPISGS